MSQASALRSTIPVQEPARKIVHRTRGRRHGSITRLMSPGDLGEVLKPFVIWKRPRYRASACIPNSGIATLTHLFEGDIRYEDTTGATGVLPEGGVEWFKAGHGA